VHEGTTGALPPRVRRAPHLVGVWNARTFIVWNYATGARIEVPPPACDLLRACGEWTPVAALKRGRFVEPSAFAATVDRLLQLTLLERSDRAPHPRVRAMNTLSPWNPQAGFFHATTKDVRFVSPRVAAYRAKAHGTPSAPPPAAIKRYPHHETIDLEPPSGRDEFARVLYARRTWRRYSASPVTIDELSTILALAAGVQHWVAGADIPIPLKTSPSGGARHATEVYVVARHVQGLKQGIYHYAPARHGLTRIGRAVSKSRIRSYVPGSEYFANASAMVLFTSVFARILWRYPYARAYRAALIEAGHVCQTFLLAATRLGLAPFSVMALADSVIEHDLGIDGISESVLYAAGVGRPPRGVSWAPLARGAAPKLRPNRRMSRP
jgi:SagB-type dehydrogenase family enzyme